MANAGGTPTLRSSSHHGGDQLGWTQARRLRESCEARDLVARSEALGKRSGATKAEVAITESGRRGPSSTTLVGTGMARPFR